MQYRSLTHICFTRSIFESNWSNMKQNRWTIKYRSMTYIYLVSLIYVSHWSIIPTMMFIHQIILKILSKITSPWNIVHVDLYLFFRAKFGSHCLIIWKYDTHASNSLGDIRQNHWTMKYRSHRPTFIFRSNVTSYWPITTKYYVHLSNSVQDVMQNHWTMKYRSQWPIFILRSNFGSYWLIIPNNNIHPSVFKTQGKITGPRNICHSDLINFEVKCQVILTHNPK